MEARKLLLCCTNEKGMQLLYDSNGNQLPALHTTRVIQDYDYAKQGLARVIAVFSIVEMVTPEQLSQIQNQNK